MNRKEKIDFEVEKIIDAMIFAGDEKLHDFQGGSVFVKIPMELQDGIVYHVLYIAEDGSIEVMETRYGEGCVEFRTGHFSTFAIITSEQEGDNPLEDNQSTIGANEKMIGIVAAVVVAAAAVVAGIISKKRKK